MKKLCKIITIFLILMCLCQVVSLADSKVKYQDATIKNSKGEDVAIKKWNPAGTLTGVDKLNGQGNDIQTPTQKIVGTAINVIRIVGTGIAIIMMTYVAIKYMSAAPSEKAEFKKSATAMVVGAIVLFAASNILTVIAKFASSNIG